MKTNGTRILLIAVVLQLLVLLFSFSLGAHSVPASSEAEHSSPQLNGVAENYAGVSPHQIAHAADCATAVR